MPTALILGGANCLEADRAEALKLFTPDLVIACNHAGRDEPGRLDHWATMHPELYPKWLADRQAAGRPSPGKLWHAEHRRRCLVESEAISSWGGSSGLLCVRVAIELGCEKIVLAGVPMRKGFEHYDRAGPWLEAVQYHNNWRRRLPVMRGRVRSFSGWTAELLGRPTKEWIDG